jgi:hypothetical protein
MATYYWVGGTGTWDDTSTTNWSDASGGSNGFGPPTSADDVIFNSASNATAYTVTIASTAVCNDWTVAGPASGNVTFSGTGGMRVHGSLTWPASGMTRSYTGTTTFLATATGKTITPNGVGFGGAITFNGVDGGWTLGSALTASSQTITLTNGSFSTGNYNITAGVMSFSNSNVRSLTLGSSTVTLDQLNPWPLTTTTNLTFDSGTSTISLNAVNKNFRGGNQTYYNLSLAASNGGTSNVFGGGTFNNLNIGSRTSTGQKAVQIDTDITVNGTLTLGAANTGVRRMTIDGTGTQRTITLNGSLATLNDVDFRNIATAGTVGTWTGTRLGDAQNNSGITFSAPKTVYWNLSGTQNWSNTGWATTNNGSPSTNNFPLAQDTATFTEAGSAGTVTVDRDWFIGSIQMADGVSNRTTAFTLSTSSNALQIYGNVTLFNNLTLSGTGTLSFVNRTGTTQTITSAGVTFTQPITISAQNSTVQLVDNLTSDLDITLTQGTLDLNDNTPTCRRFNSSNSNTRTLAFGTGKIVLSGSGTVWNTANVTNLTITGTPVVDVNNNTATAATVTTGAFSEADAINFNYISGTYTLTSTSGNVYKNLNFTGFAGTVSNLGNTIYGNLIIDDAATYTGGNNAWLFAATSGTQEITTDGETLDFPLVFNAPGAVIEFQDALTQGATRPFTIVNGTVELKDSVTTTVGAFGTSGSSQKFLQSTTPGVQATLSQASGTVNVSNLTITDIEATGGATWNSFISQGNIDGGNNIGWDFLSQVGRYIYTRRKNKVILQQ